LLGVFQFNYPIHIWKMGWIEQFEDSLYNFTGSYVTERERRKRK
jgi:hypothetical protein